MSVGVDTHAHHLKYIPHGVIQVVPPLSAKPRKGLTQPWVKPIGTAVEKGHHKAMTVVVLTL